MPVRRLNRPWKRQQLEAFQRAHSNLPFCVYVIAAYLEYNREFDKLLKHNASKIEYIGGFVGRDILMDTVPPRPDQNIIYYYDRRRKSFNDRPGNITRQLRSNPYDFTQVTRMRKTQANPEGFREDTVTYRLLEPLRGDDAVDLSQNDLNNTITGATQKLGRLDYCRDVQAVDIAIQELLRQYDI